jgi:pantetheine-phosphate adenylyltransferase
MKTAIFAGTFDPPTLGHLDIIKRASKLYMRLYIAVAANESKNCSLFSIAERLKMLQDITDEFKLPTIRVVSFSGLVVDFAREVDASILIRGVRNCADFEYECQMASANRVLSGIETVCLIASPEFQHASSTLIREIAKNHGPLHKFVPKTVEQALKIRLNQKEN